jgi:hypothetical protein
MCIVYVSEWGLRAYCKSHIYTYLHVLARTWWTQSFHTWKDQLLFYADDVNMLGGSVYCITENAEI